MKIVDVTTRKFGGRLSVPARSAAREWETREGVLLSLTDESPLLIEGEVGAGRFALLPFDLDPAGNTLVSSPMALPFFQRLTAWLAGTAGTPDAVNIEVGQRAQVGVLQDLETPRLEQASSLLVSDDRSDHGRTADLVWHRGRPRLTGDILTRAGFVTFTAGADTVGVRKRSPQRHPQPVARQAMVVADEHVLAVPGGLVDIQLTISINVSQTRGI